MGAEAQCRARFNGESSEGRAQLETGFLLFRGDLFRVKVPLNTIQSITAEDGSLKIAFGEGTLELLLGPAAEKWKEKIQNPPSLMSKLGIERGNAVSIAGITDENFLASLKEVVPRFRRTIRAQSDFVLAGIEKLQDLDRIAKAAASIVPAGAVWVVWPKGQKHITEAQVISAGREAGLVDTKIASFSATHSAMKFVIPVANRAKAAKN